MPRAAAAATNGAMPVPSVPQIDLMQFKQLKEDLEEVVSITIVFSFRILVNFFVH